MHPAQNIQPTATLSLLPIPGKGQQNGEKMVPCCQVSGCPGKQFKITRSAKKRLLKTVMDKIHDYTILTIEVIWHGRLISPSFSCLHLPNQGKTWHYSKANFDFTLLATNPAHRMQSSLVYLQMCTMVRSTRIQRSINMNSEFCARGLFSREHCQGKKNPNKNLTTWILPLWL